MIIGHVADPVCIHLEVIDAISCHEQMNYLGIFNFVIDERFYPGVGCYHTLRVVINYLKDSYCEGLTRLKHELGEQTLSLAHFDVEDDSAQAFLDTHLIHLETTLLADVGFECYLGFSRNEERFFYSNNRFATSFEEMRLAKGTIEALIMALPTEHGLGLSNTKPL